MFNDVAACVLDRGSPDAGARASNQLFCRCRFLLSLSLSLSFFYRLGGGAGERGGTRRLPRWCQRGGCPP